METVITIHKEEKLLVVVYGNKLFMLSQVKKYFFRIETRCPTSGHGDGCSPHSRIQLFAACRDWWPAISGGLAVDADRADAGHKELRAYEDRWPV